MIQQLDAELSQPTETEFDVAYERVSVLIDVFRTWSDNRERVVCRRHSGVLHFAPKNIVYKRALAGRMVAQAKHEGELGHCVIVPVQPPTPHAHVQHQLTKDTFIDLAQKRAAC